MEKKYIDLHIHTNDSDGFYTPTEIVNMAIKNNTNFISISDHDSIDGIESFKKSLNKNMIGVNGIEFSSFIIIDNEKIKLHILGYGFDEKNIEFLNLVNEMKAKRRNAHIDLLKFFRQRLIILSENSMESLNFDRYCWFDREFIKCMEKDNFSEELINYYKDYFKCNKFSYGNEYELDCRKVISAIKNADGYVVLAHPMSYKLNREKISRIISKLACYGIDGIEIYQSDCSIEDSLYLEQLAKKYCLLTSVGSDFHRNINSDGRMVGRGINNNLCITETSLTNKILEKKKYYKGAKL